jgi:hypothetical protein
MCVPWASGRFLPFGGAGADIEDAEQPPERNPNREIVGERRTPTGTLRFELVKCGKERCKRCAGGPAHGPYWYAYWKRDGRTRSKYIGKQLPAADA